MLCFGEQDAVARGKVAFREAAGHQVDGSSGAAGEDHVFPVRRVDEAAHGLTTGLIELGGIGAQAVNGSVDVAVGLHTHPFLQIEHAARPLGSGCVVKIDQRFAVDLAVERGK